jgi:predicted DNA-binding protein with PD1-like motif
MHVLELRNAELMESITKQAAEHRITNAAIVALIGAADSFTVSTNPAADASGHTITSYPLPVEITATGEIIDGKPHIHAVMAIQGDPAVAGHLHKAQIGTWFADAHVIASTHHIALRANERVVLEDVTLP